MEVSELEVNSRHSVWHQYRLVFRDACYLSLSIAAALSYGVADALIFTLHQNKKGWDANKVVPFKQKTNLFLTSIYFLASLVSLVALRLVLTFCVKKSKKYTFLVASQVVGLLGLCATIAGLILHLNIPTIAGLVIYSIFTFPSFPVSLQAIGKRVGEHLDLVATANVFMMGQTVTALFFSMNLAIKTFVKTDRSVLVWIMVALWFAALISAVLYARGFALLSEKFKTRLSRRRRIKK